MVVMHTKAQKISLKKFFQRRFSENENKGRGKEKREASGKGKERKRRKMRKKRRSEKEEEEQKTISGTKIVQKVTTLANMKTISQHDEHENPITGEKCVSSEEKSLKKQRFSESGRAKPPEKGRTMHTKATKKIAKFKIKIKGSKR